MDRPPVVTVESSKAEEFKAKCADLVREGYKLVAASCGFVDAAEFNYQSCWQAIFARPWAIGFEPPAHPGKR